MSVPAREKTGTYYNYYTESRQDVEVGSAETYYNYNTESQQEEEVGLQEPTTRNPDRM
jgi:hypothetical protein